MTSKGERGTGKGEGKLRDDTLPPSPFPLPRPGRLLAIDWGTKRIGLAISDPTQTLAQPLATITRRAGRRFPLSQLRPHLETHQPVGVVVGLPLDERGGEGAAARDARVIGELIAAKTGLPVAYWDERLTTARVQRARREAGERPRDARAGLDPLAATLVLQTFLDHRRP